MPQIGYGPLTIKYFITYTPDYAGYNSDTMGGTEGKRSRGTTYLDLTLLSLSMSLGLLVLTMAMKELKFLGS